MNFTSARSLGLLFAAGIAAAAHAQVVNPSFETNAAENATTISGWATIGDAFLSNTARFSTPTAGSFQATMATATDGQFGEHAGSGTTAALAETFLGVTSGSILAASGGSARVGDVSAIRQTFTLNAGDRLLFDYDFLTDEVYKATNPGLSEFNTQPSADRNDFGFLSYRVGALSNVTKIVDTFDGYTPGTDTAFGTGFLPTPDSDPLISETGYRQYTFLAPVTGSYTFGFGVSTGESGQVGTSGVPSGLLVDNFRVVPVPEPGTWTALVLGATALLRRRKRA